ncbi:MAG: serine hydrolase domain-containing protein [Verrucomicrobiota bacterium]
MSSLRFSVCGATWSAIGGGRWRRRIGLVGLTLALAVSGVRAAEQAGALSPRIDKLFGKWEVKDSPGVIVGIMQDGKMIHARGYGMANLDHSVALTAETISESGSVAKQFTAAAVALLAVRGKLSLDDPIGKHLPEMSDAFRAVTVKMLLNHTGGVRDIHGLNDLLGRPSYSSPHTNDEAVRILSRQKTLNFEPGTEYLYSNGGYILAAAIVERVSGKGFGAFCATELFAPRGMKRTTWRDDFEAVIPGRAAGYARRGSAYRIDMPYSNLVGNGGLLTTVGDLLAWTTSLDGAKGEWGEVVKLLQTPSKLKDGRVLGYGLGLTVGEYGGLPEIGHGGSTSGYQTYLMRFPTKGLAIAVLGNAADFGSSVAAHNLASMILNVRAPRAVPVKQEASIAGLAGMYHSEQADDILRVAVRDDKLSVGGAELVSTGPMTFANSSGQTTYVFSEFGSGGQAAKLTVTSKNGVLAYAAKSMAKPTAAALAAYTGTYASEELGVSVMIAEEKGKLAVVSWPGLPAAGEPTFADGFMFRNGWHGTFTRDANGKVTGLEATNASGRCRRVKFVRQG